MIAWTCNSCSNTFRFPAIAISPVRCACGHIDHDPQFDGTPVVPPRPEVILKESTHETVDYLTLVHGLWKEAHDHIPSADSPRWFRDWMGRIPSFGCSCQDHFKETRKSIPEDFSSLDAWRRVTWMWHNSVRGRQGKPHIKWEEACEIHSWL